jgi:hypothetical protein
MDQGIVWMPDRWPGSEHLALHTFADGSTAAGGVVIGVIGQEPTRVTYTVRCDPEWKVRSVDIEIHGAERLSVTSDRRGGWTTPSGKPVPELTGCIDVDIRVTPYTKSLPIRRLGLQPGESRDVRVAVIDVPGLAIAPATQTYTCLTLSDAGGNYRFESDGVRADLVVDGDGLVVTYPGGWHRAASGS